MLRSLLLLAGILLALHTPTGWHVLLAWMLLALLPLMCLWPRARPGLMLPLGAAWAHLVALPITTLAPLEAGERVVVEARIRTVPSLDESGWQFDAQVKSAREGTWPSQRWRVRMPANVDEPAVGELWQLALRFDPPRDDAQRRLLLRDRVSAYGRLVEGPLNQRLQQAPPSLDALRARLARRIADRVADPSAAALLAALAVGVTGEVSARQWQVFNATGITHLVAISGMHVTFFAMLSMAAARRLWPLVAAWPGMPRREAFAAAAGVLLAAGYALLSGFSVPAQRTMVMLAAFLLVRQCSRCCTPAWSVATALTAVLLFDPLAALGAGMWLSFIAVAAIVMLAGARLVAGAPLPAAARLQWLVSIALLPVTVAIFGSFSAVGLLANALAIPAFTVLLVPPILLATLCHLLPTRLAGWCGDMLVDFAAMVARAIWPWLGWCAELPGALWRTEAPLSWYLLAVPAVLLALLPVRRSLRAVALLLLLSVFLLRDLRPRPGELWVDVATTGRSPALVLRTREHLLLWGTGESYGTRGRSFARHVLPLLRASPHRRIDLWLPGSLTRDDQAAATLGAAELPIERALLPPSRQAPPEMPHCGSEEWQWDGIGFRMHSASDARTCVLIATVAGESLALGAGEAVQWIAEDGARRSWILDARGLRQRQQRLRL